MKDQTMRDFLVEFMSKACDIAGDSIAHETDHLVRYEVTPTKSGDEDYVVLEFQDRKGSDSKSLDPVLSLQVVIHCPLSISVDYYDEKIDTWKRYRKGGDQDFLMDTDPAGAAEIFKDVLRSVMTMTREMV